MHFSGCTVHVTRVARHLPKMDFTRLQAKRRITESPNFVKRWTPQAVRAFCSGDSVVRTGRPHVAWKAFEGTFTRTIRIIERRELSMPKLACWWSMI